MTKKPLRVAVTGAAGQIGYSLIFRIASGEMLGKDQPIILQLLEITPALNALTGVAMELEDCAFPLLHEVVQTDDPKIAFRDCDIAILVGARPRSKGMERKDLLEANAAIFSLQGKILNEVASRDVKVLVVGNPANTNALITLKSAPDLDKRNITAMMRLDHNRALAQISKKLNLPIVDIKRMTVWGNHSVTQYPDIFNAEHESHKVWGDIRDENWLKNEFIPTVQKRGGAIIETRGLSSAVSAANAAIDHIRDWCNGTAKSDWVSMGVLADGSYGITDEIMFGFPCICQNGEYKIIQGLEFNEFSKERIALTRKELIEERQAVEHLFKK